MPTAKGTYMTNRRNTSRDISTMASICAFPYASRQNCTDNTSMSRARKHGRPPYSFNQTSSRPFPDQTLHHNGFAGARRA